MSFLYSYFFTCRQVLQADEYKFSQLELKIQNFESVRLEDLTAMGLFPLLNNSYMQATK